LWSGHKLDANDLNTLSPEVRERAFDLAHRDAVRNELRDLASTGLASAWIEDFLEQSAAAAVLDWQVGEAIAEAILQEDLGVIFPWNSRRDERVPKASLPGADLVGLSTTADGAVLVFGEVKSSADHGCPPGVVAGKSGMIQQLERILGDPGVQLTLIQWLVARIPDGTLGDLFNEALGRFVNTQGAAVRLVGALIRDTTPNEADVSARGQLLGDKATEPGTVELLVWYLPVPMNEWPGLVAA